MIKVDIDNRTGMVIDVKKIENYVKQIIHYLFPKKNSHFLEIIFVDDQEIAKLNKKHLKRNGATDIISFPNANLEIDGPRSLGSLVIAPHYLKSNNEQYEEVILHGIIHLFGLDHEVEPIIWSNKINEVKNGIFAV